MTGIAEQEGFRRLKILFVTNRYPSKQTPGDSPCIARQREALERLGYQVDLLFIDSRKSRLNYLKGAWRVFWTTQVCRRYDVVHAHYGFYCGLSACFQIARPTVITFRGSDVLTRRERGVSRSAARFARQSIVMSEEMKQVLGDDTAAIIPYGIDLELFRPDSRVAARRELGLPENSPLVLFPYDPRRSIKRFDLVERSLNDLRDEFPDIEVVAIRDKPYQSIPVYMNACDVLLLTSDTEGAPVAIREAMACNLPIVSVDVGDVREVIGTTDGCSITERDPQDIARHIAGILRSGKRSDGRQVALSMSVSKYARAVADIYDNLNCESIRQPAWNSRQSAGVLPQSDHDGLAAGNTE